MKAGIFAFAAVLALAFGAATAVGAQKKSGAHKKGTAAIGAEAKQIFESRCVPCHGAEGKGNGPASTALTPKPRNWTDNEWQKSVSDDSIAKVIQYGGMAVGKSALMPGNPDVKPEVIDDLVKLVRGYAEK